MHLLSSIACLYRSNHNKSVLSKSEQSNENKNCNCRNPNACPMDGNCNDQAPVVQKLDSTIHRINLYPVDKAIGFPNTYPLDSDLSGG